MRTIRLHILLAIAVSCLPAAAQRPTVVRDVRVAINRGDLAKAAQAAEAYKARSGADAFYLEALSWVGRGQLAAKSYDAAWQAAALTREGALGLLRSRKLDAERALPTALGASIEVQGQVLNARGQRSEAVSFLQAELKRWTGTSIQTRIQKNLNLVTLAGKPVPPVQMTEWLGAKPPSIQSLKGRKAVLFFWAHWCGDCKQQAPVLARLKRELGAKLAVVGPTQPYGYVARGEEAPRAEELKYIDGIREQIYSSIDGMTVPVSEANFKSWGVSTTPTLAVVNEKGIVSLYHPGTMTYEELLPYVRE